MLTLDGKVVVITGAGSGIGRALALRAARQGAILAISDWDEVGLVETAQQVQTSTHQVVRTDKIDVRDRAAVAAYAASVREELGRVNVLVNNAGVALHGDFEEVSSKSPCSATPALFTRTLTRPSSSRTDAA